MLTITPAENTPEVVKNRFTTEPAANNHGYTSAFYAIDTKNKYKYLIEVLTGPRPLYVITAADQYTKYIICLEQKSPRTIDIRHAEVYKTGSNYRERREEAPRLLKKYSFIACLLYGLIKNGEAPAGATEEQPAEIITTGKPYPVILYRINAAARFMILDKNNNVWIDGPAAELEAHKNEIRKTEPAAAFTDETGARYVFRVYDSWTVNAAILREYTITAATEEAAQETARALAAGQPYSVNKAYSPTTPESNTPGENTTGAAPENATTRPKRRTAYRVECRSPRGSWTTYSDEQPTREDAARIMEEAENRNTRTTDGAPVFYRIVQIDKGPATPDPLPEESTPEENTTTGSRDSVNKATTAEKAPGRPETSTPAQDTTGSETRPPRAADKPQKDPQNVCRDSAHKQTAGAATKTTGPAATRPAGTAGKGPPAPTKDAPQAPQRAGKSHTGQTHHEPRHAPPRARETAKRPPADGGKSYKQWKIGFFQDHHKIESPMWKDTRLCGYRVDNPPK